MRVTDRGIAYLRNLKSLRSLDLLGAQVSDDSMDILAGMQSLQGVNLYRTLTTNSGLARLQSLKGLSDIDVRYSRVTTNGVAALRAALPQAKVRFDGAALPKTSVASAKPAASSPQAIVAWIKAMGGKAEMTDGGIVAIDLGSSPLSDAQLAYLEGLHDWKARTADNASLGSRSGFRRKANRAQGAESG